MTGVFGLGFIGRKAAAEFVPGLVDAVPMPAFSSDPFFDLEGVNLGPDTANRKLLIQLSGRLNGAAPTMAAIVGGTTATLKIHSVSGGLLRYLGVVDEPGTEATIRLQPGGTFTNYGLGLAVYAYEGSTTMLEGSTSFPSTGGSDTLTTSPGGVIVAGSWSNNIGVTYSGVDKAHEQAFAAGAYSGGFAIAGGASRLVSITPDVNFVSAFAASFAP